MEEIKAILRLIVDDLEGLRSYQVLLADKVGQGTSIAAAAEAKMMAKREIEKVYKPVRALIEALAD